ncbi:chromate transporter [Rhizobium sp. XQZ8]|uniref:chromate transporter n=1 Tax=Rhizobium populisoli TaxID=2859785 RepID=UPI001C68291D|nr:chromate transporter [Rhizobium populisoli]MBW6422254.1 chromate transporter [Rhizobium populisoli]
MNVQSEGRREQAGVSMPLLSLFWVFCRIGAFSFGGGLSGWVYREVVLMRPWMTEEEFLSALAVSQILPGANITNLAVCVGLKRGFIGASVAVCGLLMVPFFAVISLFSLYNQVAGLGWLTSALDGVTAAAIGLLLMTVWKGGRSAVRNISSGLALLATFVMIGILHWPLVPVVFGVGILSVAAAWPRKSKDA